MEGNCLAHVNSLEIPTSREEVKMQQNLFPCQRFGSESEYSTNHSQCPKALPGTVLEQAFDNVNITGHTVDVGSVSSSYVRNKFPTER